MKYSSKPSGKSTGSTIRRSGAPIAAGKASTMTSKAFKGGAVVKQSTHPAYSKKGR